MYLNAPICVCELRVRLYINDHLAHISAIFLLVTKAFKHAFVAT